MSDNVKISDSTEIIFGPEKRGVKWHKTEGGIWKGLCNQERRKTMERKGYKLVKNNALKREEL